MLRVLGKLLLALLVAGVAGELGVRWLESRSGESYAVDLDASLNVSEMLYQPHPYLGYVLRPGAKADPRLIKQYTVNSLGFRGGEISAEKPAGTFRVACLGGSTTWCGGVSEDAAAWPARLEALLNERLPDSSPYERVEVINAGVSGYTLMESFVNLKMRVLPLQPDLVIVYHAVNDARVIGRGRFKPDYTHVRKAWEIPLPSAWDVLFRWSHLYGFAKRKLDPDAGETNLFDVVYRKDFDAEPAERFTPGLANFRRTLTEMVALARVNRAELVVTSFDYCRDARLGRGTLENEFALVDEINEVAWQVAGEQDAPWIDVAECVPDDPALFNDAVHFNDDGCRRVAEVLADGIVAAGLLGERATPRGVRLIKDG